MSDPSHADLYLARLAAKPVYRWTIYTVFSLTAIASLYERVGLARTYQVLPWYGSILGLYGAGMALVARDNRCRIVYGCFGLLVVTAFSRSLLAGWTRVVGSVEVAACLALLGAFVSLSGDEGLARRGAVLRSDPSEQRTNQEESDE